MNIKGSSWWIVDGLRTQKIERIPPDVRVNPEISEADLSAKMKLNSLVTGAEQLITDFRLARKPSHAHHTIGHNLNFSHKNFLKIIRKNKNNAKSLII